METDADASEVIEVDEIICCTGYKLSYPYLDPTLIDKLLLRYTIGATSVTYVDVDVNVESGGGRDGARECARL